MPLYLILYFLLNVDATEKRSGICLKNFPLPHPGYLGSIHQVCRRGGRRVLQIFQKHFRSPRDHRPKYFMAQ